MQVIAALRNMSLQHHEFKLWLRDTEQLQLFVPAGMEEREMHSASLKKAELECRHLELEARESTERAARAKAERDMTCHEAAMAMFIPTLMGGCSQTQESLAQVLELITLLRFMVIILCQISFSFMGNVVIVLYVLLLHLLD